MVATQDPYNNGGSWRCDLCLETELGALSHHCDACRYDLCSRCVSLREQAWADPVARALEAGDVTALGTLIVQGTGVDQLTEGVRPIYLASLEGHTACVKVGQNLQVPFCVVLSCQD
jgi:hypothetical protein